METATAQPVNGNLYIPSTVVAYEGLSYYQIRLGLQGYPGTGKTTAADTFPNPLYLNLDNKLNSLNRSNIQQIPFYDIEWWKKSYRKGQEERHDSVLRWIAEEGPKLKREQTLVLDSWTTLQNWFDITVGKIKFFTSAGKEDGFKFWNLKAKFGQEICEVLKMVNCNVVCIFHETVERDDEGRVTGVKPLMQGSFSDQLAGNFTDWFRQITQENSSDKNKTDYLWQVRSDGKVKCLTSRKIPDAIKIVPASYEFFKRKF